MSGTTESSAGSALGRSRPRRLLPTLLLVGLLGAGLVFACAPAFAGTATDRPLLFSFDGHDTTAGTFAGVQRLGIDDQTDDVYVMDIGRDVIDKFDATGTAANFASTGASSLTGSATPQANFGLNGEGDISIDNSGTASQGRIYVNAEYGPVSAFGSDGGYLWQEPASVFSDDCGTAVDATGHLWVGQYGNNEATQFDTAGTPPPAIAHVPATQGNPCRINLDKSDNLYMVPYGGNVQKYVGGTFDSTIDGGSNADVGIDQSSVSGHLFAIHSGDFSEYTAAGALVGTYGAGSIGDGRGIAYDASSDRVYVADDSTNVIKVFGAPISGTVPDVTIAPTSGIGIKSAHFSGTINPQSVNNTWHFEWKHNYEGWASAQSSPALSAPVDSVGHPVSYDATGLTGANDYDVRLVAINTDNNLRAYSAEDHFTTLPQPVPLVTINAASSVTGFSAHLSGMVNPNNDDATWQFSLSTDPACADGTSGFQDLAQHNLAATNAATPVSDDATGLLPVQHYCVILKANNAGGEGDSPPPPVEFTTPAVPPDNVATLGASPRLDTSARLNASINPEGSSADYHFEWSTDGTNWTVLPDQSAGNGRSTIFASTTLTGLQPQTTYHFRFFAQDSAHAFPMVEGGEKTFTTRSAADVTINPRGVELVNNPNKGNQNVSPVTHIFPDGNHALWTVFSGAPGASIGAGNTFLATRIASGWVNKSLVPPPEDQIDAGALSLSYYSTAVSTDYANTLFTVSQASNNEPVPHHFVRVDNQSGTEQELTAPGGFPSDHFNDQQFDYSDDGMHLFDYALTDNGQLVDWGAGPPGVTVSILPDGDPTSCGIDGFYSRGEHWVSRDGSRAYFLSRGSDCNEPDHLYMRDLGTNTTYDVSSPPVSGPDADASFIRITDDGTSVLLRTAAKLTADDGNGTSDIYRWTEGSGATCLTCDPPQGVADVSGGNIYASEDLSRIYFGSSNALVPGQGTDGQPNLYEWHNGTIIFIGIVPDFGSAFFSAVTPDAHAFLLSSTTPLTSDNTGGSNQLYRYDDTDNSWTCVSCRPDGSPTTDDIGSDFGGGVPYAISDDGNTVAFLQDASLIPADVNKSGDVYEWHNDKLALVTDGVTEWPIGLGGMSLQGMDTTGANIFFTVAATITGFEGDHGANLYDARDFGGFHPPTPPAICREDSCQGPLQPAPALDSPGSLGYNGPKNVTPKKSQKKHHKKKHHHQKKKKHHKRHVTTTHRHG